MSNRNAFLDMIAAAEGTAAVGHNRGYDVIVGSTPQRPILFLSYDDHPRVLYGAIKSTAAGRYQLLARYFDIYRVKLTLPDFSPPCQDAIALCQIREFQALEDIDVGRLEQAIAKCCHIWASFPGAPYGQPTKSLQEMKDAYTRAGGTLADGVSNVAVAG